MINLHIGTLTTGLEVDRVVQRIINEVVPAIETASGGDIRLKILNRGTIAVSGWKTEGAVSSETLHRALEAMTGDQAGQINDNNIGLLVADRFEPARNFFGIMFDEAFNPTSSDTWALSAREGCAVFLGGIQDGRGPSDRLDETVFTAIHELGHVFNMQHSGWPSYMYESAKFGQVPLNKARFSKKECDLLAQCSKSRYIWPGGSAYGDLGDLAKLSANSLPSNGNEPTLSLKIGINHRRFFHFEPVELDIELTNNAEGLLSVPDALDAGYAQFRIWIENPDGCRRFLRSPRHYCAPRGELEITRNRPFKRDISIFGESGCYTFRQAGEHKLWVTFHYAPGHTITSNTIEFEILEREPDNQFYLDANGFLAKKQIGRLLYYRHMPLARIRALNSISDFCAAYPRYPASAMMHYAAGRALTRFVAERGFSNSALIQEAHRHLKLAARRQQLGLHRQQRAEEYLSQLANKVY